jgi:hypothetical protein
MEADQRHYLVDKNGNRIGVVLNMEEYQKLLAEAEELESIRAFDQAKASAEKALPFEQAVSEIERHSR